MHTHDIDQATADAVAAGRIARGLPAMLSEVYAAARAHADGQLFTPSTRGMQLLIELTRDSWRVDQAALERAQSPAPFAAPAPSWLQELYADEPRLLTDEVPGYLLSQPPIAFGPAPLPPHLGHGGGGE